MTRKMLMRSYCKGVFITALLFVCLSRVNAELPEQATAWELLLVDSGWLQQQLDEPHIVILDVRSPQEYQRGHIVGAVNLPATYTYQSASRKRIVLQQDFEVILGSLGVHNDSHVIIYGSAVYKNAARVFWALDLYGHTQLSVLNGAFPGWQAAGLPADTRQPLIMPVEYRAAIHPGKMATRLQIQLAIDNPLIAILDGRDVAEFQGAESRATRSGHIPTAINIAKGENLEVRQGIHHLKSLPALEKLYAAVDKYRKTIVYCHAGSESAIGYLALRLLDKDVSLYDGAWQEWSSDSGLPITSLVP